MYKKYIYTGHIFEIYEYDSYFHGKGKEKGDSGRNYESENKLDNYKNRQVERNNFVRRYACANFDSKHDKFITLTFKDNIIDVKLANNLFHTFIIRLRHYLKSINFNNFKYLAVIEFQDLNRNGVVHYHMLSNFPYIDFLKLKEIWKYGSVFINSIKHVDNIGAYITKYMTKDINDTRLMGLKAYLRSNNLISPKQKIFKYENLQNKFESENNLSDFTKVFESSYETDIFGTCKYTQYNLKRGKK